MCGFQDNEPSIILAIVSHMYNLAVFNGLALIFYKKLVYKKPNTGHPKI